MSPLLRIGVAAAVITAALVATLAITPSSAAAGSGSTVSDSRVSGSTASGSAARPPPAPVTIGGITFPYLRVGIGAPYSSEYSYDDVQFASTDWESGSDVTGWTVDLHITVMHGERLRSGTALRDWFIAYQERPADEARYLPTSLHGRPGGSRATRSSGWSDPGRQSA